jgi:hypothetical protein
MGDYGFDLGGFEDLAFDDYYGGFDLDLGSLPNFGFDLGGINLGDLGLGSLDLGGLNFDIGGLDLGGVDLGGVDLGNLDLGNITDINIGPEITGGDVALVDLTQPGNYGFGDISDEVYQGSMGIPGLEGFGDISDTVYQGSMGIPGIEGFGDISDEVYQGSMGIPGIEGFGDVSDEVYQGSMGIPGIEGFGDVSDEVYQGATGTDPFEVDGRQGSRTEDTATKGTDEDRTKPDGTQCPEGYVYDAATKQCKKATTTDTKQCPTGYTYDPVSKQCVKSKTTTTTGISKDNAMLMALLGGLLGLLSKGSAPKGPVGYQGGIPKYTATRGTPTAPTAGGRRPGGAGIPSLTGGVSFQRAAQGGLMGLSAGGRPARYLRGGTDGMADKIKTDIDGKQPARLSHGEFVIPADVVSHLGNGNSDAGADVLYDMMAKIRKARTGTTKQGKQINPRKYTPA